MSAVESVNSWKSTSAGTKAAVFVGLGLAAAVVLWLNFFS
jgi:hypothetical protein